MIIQDKTQPQLMPLIMALPLFTSLLGLTFCAWIAFGNNADICFTAGCSLSSDMDIGGMSLWWFGCIAFSFLSVLSLSGRPWLGLFAAGMCILADTLLLALMLTTAPCLSCLVVAVLFVFVYMAFRRECTRNYDKEDKKRSWILMIWLVFFIGNAGAVLRDSMGSWSIYGAELPAISVYFSPSCAHCREAVNALSGNVQAAFYPIAEKPEDVVVIARMGALLDAGENMMTALEKARVMTETAATDDIGVLESLLLNFRLQRNKSHVALAGSSVVPFIEYRGLPTFLQERHENARSGIPPAPQQAPALPPPINTYEAENLDATLPFDTGDTGDTGIAGSCGGDGIEAEPCPE